MPALVCVADRLDWHGPLLWLSQLADGLAARGWSVTIAARRDGPARHHIWRRGISLAPLKPLVFGCPRLSSWRHLCRDHKEPVLIQSCDMPSHLWTRMYPAPTKQALYSALYLDPVAPSLCLGVMLRHLHARDIGLCTPFRLVANQLQTHRLPVHKIVLLPLGIRVPPIQPQELASVRSSWHLPSSAKLIVAIPSSRQHSDVKNLLWALDILRHADPSLHLAVLAPERQQEQWTQLAGHLRLSPHITFVGAPDDMILWIALADLVWLSGERNYTWFLVLCALALGKCVVVSQNPILAEILGPAAPSGYLVPQHDPVAWARATWTILENSESLSYLADNARHYAAEAFDFDTCLQAYDDFYRQLLAHFSP
ncbi:D-inositol-3-phosphate glycosyltransferase [bacterium HR36]|nr:D-inositol-3-phosphate glycosyltransferase [bacterium HR36]